MKILLTILLWFLVPLAFISIIIAIFVEIVWGSLSHNLFLEEYLDWLDSKLTPLIKKAQFYDY